MVLYSYVLNPSIHYGFSILLNYRYVIDTCHPQNQVDIRIRDICFAFVSNNIRTRI